MQIVDSQIIKNSRIFSPYTLLPSPLKQLAYNITLI